jgi:hypothetical protein
LLSPACASITRPARTDKAAMGVEGIME